MAGKQTPNPSVTPGFSQVPQEQSQSEPISSYQMQPLIISENPVDG